MTSGSCSSSHERGPVHIGRAGDLYVNRFPHVGQTKT